MPARLALLVFAKLPVPGRVKTRLTPPLAPADAAGLYEAFLRDALDLYAAQASGADPFDLGEPVDVRLYLAGEAPGPSGLVPPAVPTFRQRGRGLGERMLRAFVETFAAGYEQVVIVGTDSPTLPVAFYTAAFDALEEPMTGVLGPSDDGGFVLLGLNDVDPYLFDMAYSHDGVLDETLGRLGSCGMTAVVLPSHYDVDEAAALRRLVADWRGGVPVGARTARFLETLTARYPALA